MYKEEQPRSTDHKLRIVVVLKTDALDWRRNWDTNSMLWSGLMYCVNSLAKTAVSCLNSLQTGMRISIWRNGSLWRDGMGSAKILLLLLLLICNLRFLFCCCRCRKSIRNNTYSVWCQAHSTVIWGDRFESQFGPAVALAIAFSNLYIYFYHCLCIYCSCWNSLCWIAYALLKMSARHLTRLHVANRTALL